MACSSGLLTDEDGDQSEWIEIHNPQSTEVNLGGWYLTDDPSNLAKWQLPTTSVGPGGYLVVVDQEDGLLL